MRHHSKVKKFNRSRNQRKALLSSLALSLIERGAIQTTEAKAKALRPYVERLVTAAKKDTVASKRLLSAKLGAGANVSKFAASVKENFGERKGGYTRITKLPKRVKDASPQALIEFVK